MPVAAPISLGQITDGASAWAEFFDGVTAAFEANESALPVIGIVLAVIVVMAINFRVAWWLAKRWSGRRASQGSSSTRQARGGRAG